MIISDRQRDENFQEYLRLKQDPNYDSVTFDEQSGGVSALHINHKLDKQQGLYGAKRGTYELKTIDTLRQNGHSIIMLNESTEVGIKQYDGLLDGIPCEVKAIEMMGRWTIRTKLANAIKQGASIIVLYFPNTSIFSKQRIQDGWKDYLSYSNPADSIPDIKLLCMSDGIIHSIEKPSW